MVEINKLSEEKLQTISEFIDHSILFETSEKEDTAHAIIENGIAEFSYDSYIKTTNPHIPVF